MTGRTVPLHVLAHITACSWRTNQGRITSTGGRRWIQRTAENVLWHEVSFWNHPELTDTGWPLLNEMRGLSAFWRHIMQSVPSWCFQTLSRPAGCHLLSHGNTAKDRIESKAADISSHIFLRIFFLRLPLSFGFDTLHTHTHTHTHIYIYVWEEDMCLSTMFLKSRTPDYNEKMAVPFPHCPKTWALKHVHSYYCSLGQIWEFNT